MGKICRAIRGECQHQTEVQIGVGRALDDHSVSRLTVAWQAMANADASFAFGIFKCDANGGIGAFGYVKAGINLIPLR